MDVETIRMSGQVLAIILRKNFSAEGIHFVTPPDFSQQLAYMHHPAGKIIQPHVHNPVHRDVTYTQEVLFIKRGKLRIDFYDGKQKYLESRVLVSGDIVLLASAGHGFEILEEIEMFEVKQGPYLEHEDKVRFDGISAHQAIIKNEEDHHG